MSDDKDIRRDKINVALEEYRTLRAEIMNRTGYGFQAGAAFAAVITWLSQQPKASFWDWSWIVFPVIFIFGVAFVFFRRNNQEIWNAGSRLRELEHSINSRAGAHLLQWERRFGGSRDSFFKSLFNPSPPLAERDLPPLTNA
jgi:hypothetical protein